MEIKKKINEFMRNNTMKVNAAKQVAKQQAKDYSKELKTSYQGIKTYGQLWSEWKRLFKGIFNGKPK